MWQWYVCGAALVVAGIRYRLHRSWGIAKSQDRNALKGRTVLVTGATSGLGLEAVVELVSRGARVILACRDVTRGRQIVAEIREKHPSGGELIVMELDLASLESIRAFTEVVKTGFTKIDILINNAGVYYPTTMHEKTKDGFEAHVGVNHLGHFYLTHSIISLLKNARPSRVVIVSSLLHEKGNIDIGDLNMEKIYEAIGNKDKAVLKQYKRHSPGYCTSKLMNVYFGRALAERTKSSGIHVYTVCPGFTYTNLFRYSFRWFHMLLMAPVFLFYLRTPKEGVQTIIHCATDPSLANETGGFYRNCAPYVSKVEFDMEVQNKLWDVSNELIKTALDKIN